MSDELLTADQKKVLCCASRITVVRAGPGSGKTKVFVEALRKEAEIKETGRVAALSFTNVAQKEIGRRISSLDRTRHFLGTLDSFFLRFVVRPFSHLLEINGGVELVPASVQASVKSFNTKSWQMGADRVFIGDISFVGGTGDIPKMAYQGKWGRKLVPDAFAQAVRIEKLKLWRATHMITHSDSHFLAAAILASKQGQRVVETIARRFPMLLIDEFQDTNWFHLRALMRLLSFQEIRALIVGDPGQSIYEFGGADPKSFDDVAKLENTTVFTLKTSHRCPSAITNVLAAFRGPTFNIDSSKIEKGQAIILVHALDKPRVDSQFIAALKTLTASSADVMVVARQDSILQKISGQGIEEKVEGSTVCDRLHEASHMFLSGNCKEAANVVGQILANFLLNGRRPTIQRLQDAGISIRQWRTSVYHILETAVGEPEQSWGDWSAAIRVQIEKEVAVLSGVPKKLGAQIKAVKNKGLRLFPKLKQFNNEWPVKFRVSNIHQVKGAEFDTVVMFVPKAKPPKNICPSVAWWTEPSEEQRVAFVAMSRPKQTLIICFHKETYQNICVKHPEFVKAFEIKYVVSS